MSKRKPKNPAKDRAPRGGIPGVFAERIDDKTFGKIPENCFVVPMMILDPPEPIKDRKSSRN